MIDVAQLGLSVRSDGVVVATKSLDKLEKASKRAETAQERLAKQAEKVSKSMRNIGRSMQLTGSRMSLFFTAPLVAAGFAAVRLAVDAEETANKFDVVFRGSVDRATASLKELTNTVPLTLTEMKALSAQTQDMLVPMGLARDAAADLSVDAVKLAGDLASFNNVPVADVLANIGSALAGQSEPLRKYGIDVRKTRLESIALAEGLIQVGDEMTNAATAQATFIAITRDSSDAMGDAARTVNSTANEARFLARDFKQLQEDVGRDLIPVYKELLQLLQEGLNWFKQLTPEQRKTAIQMAAITAATGPLVLVLGSLVRVLGTLLPLLVRLGGLLGPASVIAIGVGLLVKLIGDQYVRSIEDAISGTKRYIGTLNDLKRAVDLMGLQSNLDAVNERIIDAARRHAELQAELSALARHRGDLDQEGINIPGLDQLREDIAQLERELGQLRRLREQYEFDINALTKIEVDPAVLQELARSFKFLEESMGGDGPTFDSEALEKLVDTLDPAAKAMRDLAEARELLNAARGKLGEEEYHRLLDLLMRSELAMDAFAESIGKVKKVSANVLNELEKSFQFVEGLELEAALEAEIAALQGGEKAWREYAKAVFVAQQVAALGPKATEKQIEAIQELAETLFDLREEMNFEGVWEGMLSGIDPAISGLQRLGAELETINEAIGRGLISETEASFMRMGLTARFAFDALAKGAEQGSKAQRAFAFAAEVANAVLAIQAILNQASGDPYTAFARMAAMAAIVASLGYSAAGSFGGGSHVDIAAQRQETQGTGGVLGDAAAKSESILKASEITADATSELVGINRGMLHALQALQDGIQGAVVQLARGAGGADFGGLPSTFNTTLLHGDILGKSLLGKLIDSIFGGSSKLVDEGIAILGGSIDEIIIQAFRTVSVKKHIFSGTKITDEFQDLGDEINSQFQLVFDSIETTVREAALALGIPLDVIQARIESFEVAAQQISLMDLSAEEQRAELLAVFGSIFDDLASHVVPFIDQFQKVGEGLGETLVRVSTSVQVFEEAVQQLGFAADMSDPEAVAQMAVGLVDLAGGVSEFISQFSAFMDKFASDEQKLAFATDQLTRAFDDVGLVIPETREGMWDLMRSMDASTEAGREQIATILRLANVADEYYKLLEDSALRTIRDFADADFAADYQRMVQLQGEAPTATLTRLARELFDAVAAFDNTPGSLAEIANGFSNVQQAGINAVSSIDAAWKGLTATIDRLRQDTLDIIAGPKSEREIFVDAAGLVDQARTAQTPEELTRLVAQFDSLVRQLTPETAQRLGGNLIDLIDRFQGASDASFDRIRDQTLDAIASMQTMADAFLTSIPDALALVASTNERAAMALEAIAGVEGSVPGVSSPADTAAISNVLGASFANQEQILVTGTTMMADALRSGTASLQQNIASAIQSGFGNARIVVNVQVADNGLATQ